MIALDYSKVVNVVSVTGWINAEVARILLDAQEKITALGFECKAQLGLYPALKSSEPDDMVPERERRLAVAKANNATPTMVTR